MQIRKSSAHQLAGPLVGHATKPDGSVPKSLSLLTPVPTPMPQQPCTRSYPNCRTPSSSAGAYLVETFTGTFLGR
jgi:hypothetical protein